jgi:hypothetical protein
MRKLIAGVEDFAVDGKTEGSQGNGGMWGRRVVGGYGLNVSIRRVACSVGGNVSRSRRGLVPAYEICTRDHDLSLDHRRSHAKRRRR